jgi:hypothetical protein
MPNKGCLSGIRSNNKCKEFSNIRIYIQSEVFLVKARCLQRDQVIYSHFSAEENSEFTHVLIEYSLQCGVRVVRKVIDY